MRILHLAPPSSSPASVTAHTFIDEEIAALRTAGAECLTASDAVQDERELNGVQVIPVASPPRASHVCRTLALIARHPGLLPSGVSTVEAAKTVFHALRIEEAAATAIVERRIDVVHSHFGWPGGFGGMVAAAQTGAPLIASLRGMDLLQRRDLSYGLRQDAAYDSAVRKLAARADRTVYATEFMRAAGLDAGASPERTVVVRKGVDLERFSPPADRRAAQDALGLKGPLLLAVGTLRPLKGYPVLFDALSTVRDREWSLVVCGEGPDRAQLERKAAERHLVERVPIRRSGQPAADAAVLRGRGRLRPRLAHRSRGQRDPGGAGVRLCRGHVRLRRARRARHRR